MPVTVTLNEVVAVFPTPSVAVHVTVVVPTANEAPGPGVQTTLDAPRLSVAAGGVKVTTWLMAPGAATTLTSGCAAAKTGGLMSILSSSTRFCVVLMAMASSAVSPSLADMTTPGGVPSALFAAVTGPVMPPAGPYVAAPTSGLPMPLSQMSLTTT